MSSRRLANLNALKQSIVSFVVAKTKGLGCSQSATNRVVRITRANKVVEARRRAVNSFGGDIVRIAALIGLASAPLPVSQKKMSEEEQPTLESVLQNADQLFDENHFQEVVDLLSKSKDQDQPEIQWRKARALYSAAKATKDKHEKEKQVRSALTLIKAALEGDSSNFAIHKWMAIILDAAAELDGIKARILQLDNIKFHMDEAVRLNPNDPTTWHMMGAYEYGLAELSWIQRKLVSTIFASPPTGSFEKALEHFEKAESLKEGFYSTNWLMIGKCHIAMKHNDKAKDYLERAANYAVLNEDDKKCKEEAAQLLRKL